MKKASRTDSDFAAQYKHPLWQKKRLEAMDAAGFVCQRCQSEEDQLHVHHRQYIKGRKLWEYGNGELEVVCHCCHEEAHAEKEILTALLARIPTTATREVISLLVGYVEASVCTVDVNALGDAFKAIENTPARLSGSLAGLAAACCTKEEMTSLGRQLTDSFFGGEVHLVISGDAINDESLET